MRHYRGIQHPAVLHVEHVQALFRGRLGKVNQGQYIAFAVLDAVISRHRLLEGPPVDHPFQLHGVVERHDLIGRLNRCCGGFSRNRLSFRREIRTGERQEHGRKKKFDDMILHDFLRPEKYSAAKLRIFRPSSSVKRVNFIEITRLQSPVTVLSVPSRTQTWHARWHCAHTCANGAWCPTTSCIQSSPCEAR